MSEDKANESRWLSVLDFQQMFAGAKSMAIVGSASSILQWENGDYIDSHDVVVRFNRTTVDGMEKMIGSRTDIIVANDSNNLSKAPSPEFASAPKCVVSFVKTNSVGFRSDEERRDFLEWIGRTPLFFCPGPEVLCCEIPSRKRGFSMGTYALNALPFFLDVERLFVTGFTMFGESSGGSGHHTKKSTKASVTWHDAKLERYVAANVLGHHTCELTVTEEVAEFMDIEGFSATVLDAADGEKHLKPPKGFNVLWYLVGRISKLFISIGYYLRSFAEKRTTKEKSRRKP